MLELDSRLSVLPYFNEYIPMIKEFLRKLSVLPYFNVQFNLNTIDDIVLSVLPYFNFRTGFTRQSLPCLSVLPYFNWYYFTHGKTHDLYFQFFLISTFIKLEVSDSAGCFQFFLISTASSTSKIFRIELSVLPYFNPLWRRWRKIGNSFSSSLFQLVTYPPSDNITIFQFFLISTRRQNIYWCFQSFQFFLISTR